MISSNPHVDGCESKTYHNPSMSSTPYLANRVFTVIDGDTGNEVHRQRSLFSPHIGCVIHYRMKIYKGKFACSKTSHGCRFPGCQNYHKISQGQKYPDEELNIEEQGTNLLPPFRARE